MASWVLSECGLRPLPSVFPRPRTGIISKNIPTKIRLSENTIGGIRVTDRKPIWVSSGSRDRGWGLKVSAPSRVVSVDGEDREEGESINGVLKEDEVNPGASPPFGLADIRAAIPKHCWVKDPWRSMSYVVRDVVVVFGLAAVAAYLNNWFVWPLYWAAQGTMFWALFVLGHECGHGNFSNNHKLNSVVGHLLHSSILVPYQGWRMSHRSHHQNHVQAEKEESWHPLSERIYKSLDGITPSLRFMVPFPMLAYPFYLRSRSPGKKSDLFVSNERKDEITSTVCWTAMLALLVGLSCIMGPVQMLKLYFIPYSIIALWMDLSSYMHHHNGGQLHEDKLTWYGGKEWSFLRGGLSTIDGDYGLINNIHHDIGTHVMHHLIPEIPHYHLVEATEAAKPVMGKYYREPKKSGPIPFHVIESLSFVLRHPTNFQQLLKIAIMLFAGAALAFFPM